jgi:hypothetical protein
VTAVTAAIQKAPGTPSEQFVPVLRAAVTTEFAHVEALKAIGAKPLTSKFWIPNAVFDGGVGLFTGLAAVETIEVSLYLIGVTAFTVRSNAFGARLCAEALGPEAEHPRLRADQSWVARSRRRRPSPSQLTVIERGLAGRPSRRSALRIESFGSGARGNGRAAGLAT